MIAAPPATLSRTDNSALIEAAIGRAGQLAALPEVAFEVMRLVKEPRATGDDLARVLSRDLALSARVLKIVNSAYYGLRREVGSIAGAVVVMGFGAVNSIAMAASLARMYRVSRQPDGFEARDLWTHAIAVATAARLLVERVGGGDRNEAFLAGLVHDIGMIVELQACSALFETVLGAVAANPALSFREAEGQIIGANHEEFGEALCRKWRFPDELQRVSGHHHHPMSLPEGERRMAAIVHVADHLAADGGFGYTRTVESGDIDPGVLRWLGLTSANLDAMREALPARVAETMPALAGSA